MNARLTIDRPRIEAFCRKWRIVEMSLFGSSLRDDFSDDSDVNVDIVWKTVHDDVPALLARLEPLVPDEP